MEVKTCLIILITSDSGDSISNEIAITKDQTPSHLKFIKEYSKNRKENPLIQKKSTKVIYIVTRKCISRNLAILRSRRHKGPKRSAKCYREEQKNNFP